jgi:hypothetical protein
MLAFRDPKLKHWSVGLGDLTAATAKGSVYCVASGSPLEVKRRFRGTYRLHLQG